MKPRLLIIGAGGHARVVVSIARRMDEWELAGVLDRSRSTVPEQVAGVSVIGTFDDADKLYADGIHNVVFAVGDNDERASLYTRFAALGFSFPILRHPSALIEDNAVIGEGSIICAGAIICAEVRLGSGVIVNTGAILDHETVVEDHAHIAPGCRVAGRVRIGEGVMLGIGSCVRDKINIGARTIVGAGSLVVEDIPAGVVAYGSPARIVRSRTS